MNLLHTCHSLPRRGTLLITLLLPGLFGALSAQAQPVISLGYSNYNANEVDLGFLEAKAGFTFLRYEDDNSGFTVTPELRFGTGISDDTRSLLNGPAQLEVDYMYGINLRGQWDFSESAYLFIAPSYTKFKIKGSFAGSSSSNSFDEFGLGGGLGLRLTESLGIEAGYEDIDSDEVMSLSIRYSF